jgi:hypothetical protein
MDPFAQRRYRRRTEVLMSELAFNLNGDPFEVPATATRWRVKKMKPKGPPEVVFGRDGTPLTLSIDAGMDELRHEARSEGRYRLDLVDDFGQPIPGAASGYVCVHADEPSPELAPLTKLPSENAVIEAMRMNAEAMRMNTELARSIVDRFPAVMDSTAGILRAADGAGLPAREPRGLPEPAAEDDDEPETDEVAPKPNGWMGLLETLIPLVAPAIMSAVASGKVQIPGGVGALFDCRRASPKASAEGPHTASTPGVAPAPGPRDPAPPRRGASPVPRPAGAPGRARSGGSMAAEVGTSTGHAEAPAMATAATGESPELPTLDPAALAHFGAIQAALTLREGMLARALAAELSPSDLRTWFAELQTLSVPDAVAKIRAVLRPDTGGSPDADAAPGSATGGVS